MSCTFIGKGLGLVGQSPYSAVTPSVFLGGGGGGGGGAGAYSISLVSDGSTSYQIYAVIQMTSLPTGATGYKFEITGTSRTSGAYTGVVLAVVNPANNQTYNVNTQALITDNPSDNGPQNKNMKVKYKSATDRFELYQHNGNGADNVTVKVTAIDNSYADVGTVSNTLTGIEIDDDG